MVSRALTENHYNKTSKASSRSICAMQRFIPPISQRSRDDNARITNGSTLAA